MTHSQKRRGRGEGCIVKRPDGRWVARVDLGWENGKRRRKAFYGKTRREAAGKLTKALGKVQQGGTFADERQTVAQFLERWLEHKRTRLRPRAWATYEQAIRLHLVPGLGKIALAKLTPPHVDQWFRQHQEKGASARNIRYARTVFRAALNQARKWRLVSDNVAALVDVPRHRAKEIQPLTPEQARTLLQSVKGHRLGALVSVATALGLRLGEALGLRWEDVDTDTGLLRVRQALERSGGDSAIRRSLILKTTREPKAIGGGTEAQRGTSGGSPRARGAAQAMAHGANDADTHGTEVRSQPPNHPDAAGCRQRAEGASQGATQGTARGRRRVEGFRSRVHHTNRDRARSAERDEGISVDAIGS